MAKHLAAIDDQRPSRGDGKLQNARESPVERLIVEKDIGRIAPEKLEQGARLEKRVMDFQRDPRLQHPFAAPLGRCFRMIGSRFVDDVVERHLKNDPCLIVFGLDAINAFFKSFIGNAKSKTPKCRHCRLGGIITKVG